MYIEQANAVLITIVLYVFKVHLLKNNQISSIYIIQLNNKLEIHKIYIRESKFPVYLLGIQICYTVEEESLG